MPRSTSTAERMRVLAAKAVSDFVETCADEGAVEGLACEYIGVAQTDGAYDIDAVIGARSKVAFEWRAFVNGPGAACATTIVEARCDNVVSRGVRFPPPWQTALGCRGLQTIADECAVRYASAQGLADVSLRVLGQPRSSPLPGSVELRLGDVHTTYLLLARAFDNVWVCTRGRFVEGSLDQDDPFGEDSFCLKDIVVEAADVDKKRRIGAHLRIGEITKFAAARPEACSAAVAMAIWRAELARSAHEGRLMDDERAAAGFERSPFAWRARSGRCDRSLVTCLWLWKGAERRQKFATVRLDKFLTQGVPPPAFTPIVDEELRRQLLAVAELEVEARKAPCVYLGLQVGPGKYEPDPSKWPSQHYPASMGKTKATVYYHWEHVSVDGAPHVVGLCVNHLLHDNRSLPERFCPLARSAPSGLKFDEKFMNAVASKVRDGISFKGIAYEGEKPQVVPHLPQGGLDLQDCPVYWALPDGRLLCWSVRRLSEATDDMFVEESCEEAYKCVAKELGYDVLGKAPDEVLEPFRNAPGTLAEKLWETIEWQRPPDETCSCWWIANAGERDKESPVKLVARSLASLRLELLQTRVATSMKLRQTWERRLEENSIAVDSLLSNSQLWRHVGGPDPEVLRMPAEADLLAARRAVQRLRCMLITHGPNSHDGLDVFAEEIVRSVGMLKQVTWEAIRKERFFLTPKGLYGELVRNAQTTLSLRDEESARRRARLAVAGEEEGEVVEESLQQPPLRASDKYGLDLNVFKNTSHRKPHNWQRAVRQASEVLLDEMRTLLSLHYDAVHLENWEAKHRCDSKKAPERKGEFMTFRKCIEGHRMRLNQQLELPASVKSIFRKPEDELEWRNLEQLRGVICSLLEAETEITFEGGEVEALANALEANPSAKNPDEVGEGAKVPAGSRVLLLPKMEQETGAISLDLLRERRRAVVAAVRALDPLEENIVCALLRPRDTSRAPPLDPLAQQLFEETPLELFGVAAQELLDGMLLVLWDALFLNQCETWTRQGVVNLPSDECFELARWFLRGQARSSKRLVDGLCAYCGALLHGAVNQGAALSNKCTGAPVNRDGKELCHGDGSPMTEAQPPCLLRWSPAFVAREIPELFAHDPETNKLSLRPGVERAPWLAPPSRGMADAKTWLFCNDCNQRLTGSRRQNHIPFRDRASQGFLKPVRRSGVPVRQDSPPSQVDDLPPEPEMEPAEAPEGEDGDVELEVPDLPDFPEERPTLEEYQERWTERLARHAREVPGNFSRDNLCPVPDPRLWQDCVEAPFDQLKSAEAQSRLSVCRPHSSLTPANCDDGTPRYAHITGDVCYRRRAMLQLNSMMGFLLNRKSGRFMHLTPSETDAVHETLTWMRAGNNKILTFFNTIYESFQAACSALMGRFQNVVPDGCVRARIRATRRETREPRESVLGETLGDEACGFVVVDGAGHPMKYDSLNVFESIVGTESARIQVDIPGPGGKGWQRTGSFIDTQRGEALSQNLAAGSKHLREETYVPANDPHMDARVFPCVHPYGTGSLLSEIGSGGTQHYARNRLMLLQSWFRRSAMWGFWSLSRLIQTELFFKNKARRKAGRRGASNANDPDPVARLFGTAQPADVPESSEWWKRQQRDLFSLTDEAELGLMTCMVTVTANDSSPEMLAAIRRGPFAAPTDEELIEYLLQRKRRDQERPAFEHYSLEHVLAFQRRVWNLKDCFMRRGKRTPLGIIRDWWDRTEAQMRAALHSHILVWMMLKKEPEGYTPLRPIPREAAGTDPRQRPRHQKVEALTTYQEDNMYHKAEVGRIWTEMVRPSVAGERHGGFDDYQKLRLAGLARSIQSRLYLHSCSHKYCLANRSSCRFFFPFLHPSYYFMFFNQCVFFDKSFKRFAKRRWPLQPQQQYCLNTDRVAGQRRLEEDDQWVNPHELYMAMFSPATVHCLPFDPRYGADTARQYCGKYAAKGEKHYFLETQRDGGQGQSGVRDFLKCRTVGLCMAHNRLLSFRVVRNTRPVQFTSAEFVPSRDRRTPREPTHLEKWPQYPDAQFYLSYVQKYFFRHPSLRHLRVEQFTRYFACGGDRADGVTVEDTVNEDVGAVPLEEGHRHFDDFAENTPPGTVFPSIAAGVESAKRRCQTRLAVSRVPFVEPIADKREAFYEQRLLLGLPWFCRDPAFVVDDKIVWRFHWEPPAADELGGELLEPQELALGVDAVSFEHRCAVLESRFGRHRCACCAEELPHLVCDACKWAVGFHKCLRDGVGRKRWRRGTLHDADLDAQRVLYNLHRRGLPTETLKRKADEYVGAGLLPWEDAQAAVRAIEQERGVVRTLNEIDGEDEGPERNSPHLNSEQLKILLEEREAKLQTCDLEGITDQWRVYCDICQSLSTGRFLRLMVQASAGTGKSFLLTTVYLWCIVQGRKVRAAAPTGIAASNVEIEGTSVSATTLHSMLDLDTDMATKLDFAKSENKKVKDLVEMEVLLLDEVSMMDTDAWLTLVELCSVADHNRRPNPVDGDGFGNVHVILFGDFKQLPPATSKAPFIVLPSVYDAFSFRVLRQNRRVCRDTSRQEELENFHCVLDDIAWGRSTDRVKDFIIKAYVRGASVGCAERAELEGSTGVFCKRRYRDRWNRTIVRRIARVCNHSLKLKGRVRGRGARGKDWFSERRAEMARKKSRSQAPWLLHLAGDWHPGSEKAAAPRRGKPHMMRAMLVSNLALDQRFCNGVQGRILHWHPEKAQARKVLSASHPELLVRFAKETSMKKAEMLPDVDHIDIAARQETLVNVPGLPVLVQVPAVPCYALTVHKTQAPGPSNDVKTR